ncbi:MAG TPA: phosphatidylcholine synthase [Vicinamibacteria bacterium]|nr:phosphatidylcholine synthase [Vicinamibacteria bacterium]
MPEEERGKRLRAWSVHLLTASGVAFDLAAAVVLFAPRPDPRVVFLLLLAPVVIDAVDGPLARRWDVKRWAAAVDGRTVDDIVDYLTFTFLPLLLVWRMGWVPWPALAFVLPAAVASLFGFANREAKQEADGFFRGFPSYWNVFAFYAGLWAERSGPWGPGLLVLALAALTVAPVRFVYPNLAPPPWRMPLLLGAAVWVVIVLAMLPSYPDTPGWLVAVSLVYPAAYTVLSVVLDRRQRAATA